jgi:hypothetical protein
VARRGVEIPTGRFALSLTLENTHHQSDHLPPPTEAVDIKILYTDGCTQIPARRLVALQQTIKGPSNGVCLPFAEPELTTNNTFEGPFSVTTPEVSCLFESVRYWLRLPTAVSLQKSRYLQQHSRSTYHLHSEKAGGRLIGCSLTPKFLPGSLK